MSKHNNVNPGQYKVAGRDRMGEPMGQAKDKVRVSKTRERVTSKKTTKRKG